MKVTYKRPPSTSFLSLMPGKGFINSRGQLIIKIDSGDSKQNCIVMDDGIPYLSHQDVAELVTPVNIELVVT
jgi:hypothetical protein